MENIDGEIRDLIDSINYMKHGSIGEMFLIIFYSLISYLKSLVVFGYKSNITKDNINVIKEMFNILKLEKKLLNYILKNVECFDKNATAKVILMLDELNEKTVRYYYDVIDDIETAAEMKNEFRALRPTTPLPTLIQTNLYILEVAALGENFENLKSFLGFEDEFWNYIQDKTEIIEFDFDNAENLADVEPVIVDGIVVDIKIRIPHIINLQSMLIAIREYKKAYELYKMIGCRYYKDDNDEVAILQKKYYDEYLTDKAKNLFQLKNVM